MRLIDLGALRAAAGEGGQGGSGHREGQFTNVVVSTFFVVVWNTY
jgi:hypothetical protein